MPQHPFNMTFVVFPKELIATFYALIGKGEDLKSKICLLLWSCPQLSGNLFLTALGEERFVYNVRVVMVHHIIFDLDGTLLDTIDDICFAINKALRHCGYDYQYDREGTKALVGDGADMLLHRALREKGDDLQAFSELKPIYMEYYRIHQVERAHPFEGLKEALVSLKEKGVRLSCVTNKPDALAHTILDMHFGENFFDFILGAKEGLPVKPDPISTFACIEAVGVGKEECLYVGDSHVDIATGHNAGLPVALCLWGYEVDYERIKGDAEYVLSSPNDLLSFAPLS